MTSRTDRAARIRTYAGRAGRRSALTVERLERYLPERSLPPGPLVPSVAFGRTAPVVLEIGCGHGAAAIGYASAHPEHDVLAVDVHVPGIARLLAAADVAGVTNLRVEIGDAVALLTERVGPGSLAAVHLFFPDPWPKRGHVKRRFVQASTLELLASRLTPGGHVLVATDQDAYAEHVRAEVAAQGSFLARDVARPAWRPVDGFERKGLAAGRQVSDLRLDLV
ncbi:MAG TPA: tRNA (guanosine(46)-N7)-methyltransferase TrmB [Lapillicoccus sp.]|nr:tRNA (guanosine(46)-N7)-methyltransferase TrmB [Lapillicoccus sp.]